VEETIVTGSFQNIFIEYFPSNFSPSDIIRYTVNVSALFYRRNYYEKKRA
jgi:hypothetical protein